MNEFENPVVVEFPLRGEWMAPNTPGKKIPSHGTDQLGQRYAFDFFQVDWDRKGTLFFNAKPWRYYLFGVPLNRCYCWGKEIHAPCGGTIVSAEDGWKEREPVHLLRDMFIVLKNALTFDPKKNGLQPVAGNYIIMDCGKSIFAFFAHIQNGTIAVSSGEHVSRGQVLGKVGHSGNSTAPHLHFHLMDSSDLLSAKGIPCVFAKYDLFQEGKWKTVHNTIPSDKDRIRFFS